MKFVGISDRDALFLSLLVYSNKHLWLKMAAITMPSFGDDDLYLYMREIVEKEFLKALRQACKPLWDKKHALGNGPWHHSSHLCMSLVSKPLEKLDFYELCHIMTNSRFPAWKSRLFNAKRHIGAEPLSSLLQLVACSFKGPRVAKCRQKIACICYW